MNAASVFHLSADKLLERVEYGNGGKICYSYDDFKRKKAIRRDDDAADRYTYEYGANGQLALVHDHVLNQRIYYEYDLANRPMRTYVYDPDKVTYWTKLGFDQYSNLTTYTEKIGSRKYIDTFTYDNENRPTNVQYSNSTNSVSYVYDALGRMTQRTVANAGNNYTTTYAFAAGGHGTNSTTDLITSVTQNGFNFSYEYDDVGNIISETRNGQTTTYEYDALGQLIQIIAHVAEQ